MGGRDGDGDGGAGDLGGMSVWAACPLCNEEIKRVTGDSCAEVDGYWDWVYEVKPPLPGGFAKKLRASTRKLQRRTPAPPSPGGRVSGASSASLFDGLEVESVTSDLGRGGTDERSQGARSPPPSTSGGDAGGGEGSFAGGQGGAEGGSSRIAAPEQAGQGGADHATGGGGDAQGGADLGAWEQCLDENGQTYYYNASTGQSSWTMG